MSREDPENADAAAKLAFIQGRRKPLGRCGRQTLRRVAFEETARGKLRYLEDSEGLNVSVTELQEQLGISEKLAIPLSKLLSTQ